MMPLLPTKFHEILFSSFRGVALTNCVTDRRTDGQDKNNMSPTKVVGDIKKCLLGGYKTIESLLDDFQ